MDLFPLVGPALAALGVSVQEVQIGDAQALQGRCYPSLCPDRPALIGLPSGAVQWARLRSVLGMLYPDTHPVKLVSGLESGTPQVSSLTLSQVGEAHLDPGNALLYMPALPCPGSVETFQDVVAHLRAPDGCPWDRKQTHRSLRQGFQEEAYEVLDALDRSDTERLKEELGDILLHVVLQTQIASEAGEFRMSDVICSVHSKIVRRHPHVFGDVVVGSVAEVLINWESLKQREKESRLEPASALDGISPAMPSLARAQSIQRHADRTGSTVGVGERIDHLSTALSHLVKETNPARQESALGDLLFGIADLARCLDIDAESALREANSRFERRHREAEAKLRGATFTDEQAELPQLLDGGESPGV